MRIRLKIRKLFNNLKNRKFETEMKLMILYHMTYYLEVKGEGSR